MIYYKNWGLSQNTYIVVNNTFTGLTILEIERRISAISGLSVPGLKHITEAVIKYLGSRFLLGNNQSRVFHCSMLVHIFYCNDNLISYKNTQLHKKTCVNFDYIINMFLLFI